MTEFVTPNVFCKPLSVPAKFFRLLTTTMIIGSLVACATSPTKTASAKPVAKTKPVTGIEAAADMYNSRNYPGAIREFNNIIADKDASANSHRMANLGKSLVYLGNDKKWHSLENAKMALISAGQISPGDNEEFEIETDMLMDAISAVIGTESKYVVLKGKTSGSSTQVTQLKEEMAVVEAERDELIAEQKRLNEALEKLKELTLGN
jgi:hypothetical protein